MSKSSNEGCMGSIFILGLIMLFNISIGAWSVGEILSWLGKDIPLIGDMIIGLFVAEISVPVAIVGWILRICGVF